MNADLLDQKWRADKLSPEENLARVERILRANDRMPTYHPDDSVVDYESPEFRAVAPVGWTSRRG